MKVRHVASACLVILSAAACAHAAPVAEVIKLNNGQIQGSINDGVLSFKGVPFAQPRRTPPTSPMFSTP